MSRASVQPSSNMPEVVVLGRSRVARDVATKLRADHRPVRLFDEPEALKRAPAWKGRYVVVVEAKAFADSALPSGPMLVIGTAREIGALDKKDFRRTSDFLRVHSWDSAVDPDLLEEAQQRVDRLIALAPRRIRGLRRYRFIPGHRHTAAPPGPTTALAPLSWFHPKSGRLDAQRVADSLGITLKALAEAIGRNYTAVHKTPDAPSLQQALGPFARIIELLLKLHGNPQYARGWLNTPNRELGELTPMSVMLSGRTEAVRDMVEAAYLGIPT